MEAHAEIELVDTIPPASSSLLSLRPVTHWPGNGDQLSAADIFYLSHTPRPLEGSVLILITNEEQLCISMLSEFALESSTKHPLPEDYSTSS